MVFYNPVKPCNLYPKSVIPKLWKKKKPQQNSPKLYILATTKPSVTTNSAFKQKRTTHPVYKGLEAYYELY